MKSLKGVVVYDKNLRRMGKVIREDSFSIYIEYPPLQGASPEYVVVTPGVFKKRFIFSEVEELAASETKKRKPQLKGEIGDGAKLWSTFRNKLNNLINTNIKIAHVKSNVLDIFYKEIRVLRVSIMPKKLVILADTSALSPQVYHKVSKVLNYGKLRARFDVYDEKGISTFFTSLIIDCMYKAKILEEKRNGKNHE